MPSDMKKQMLMMENLIDNSHYRYLKDTIVRHEGKSNKLYYDTLGNATIGYGHLVSGDVDPELKISDLEADALLDYDIADAQLEVEKLDKDILKNLNKVRLNVITNMMFNLGPGKLREFKKMFKYIKEGKFDKAADEMLKSKWAKQVKNRAIELSNMMRTGEYQ